MEKNRKKILKGAIILFVSAALIFSTAAVTADTQKPELTLTNEQAPQQLGTIVWDNGMEYTGLGAAQWDEAGQFDAYLADDFEFTEPTEVCDVHWIGGYWVGTEPASAEFDWCISFYYDDGTGNSPTGTPYTPSLAGPFCYAWDEIEKEEIEPGYYEMSVDLPENIPFDEGKYWISIWGVGAFPPQSGWGLHEDPIRLHMAVFGSDYFGFTFWTNSEDVFGYAADMCFQLTTKEEAIPKICCDPVGMNWADIPPGGTVTGQIYVCNCGEDGSFLSFKVDSWPTWGTWTFNPPTGSGIPEGDCVVINVTVIAPPDENTDFTGEIVIINTDDPTDYCVISTTLQTPLNSQSMNLMQTIMNTLMQRFA